MRPPRLRRATNGLAISTILLAVVLLAAIAVAIGLSSRSGNASSSTQQARLGASELVSMGQNIKTGFERMAAQGVDITAITLDHDPTTGVYDPTHGGVPDQGQPIQALSSTAPSDTWNYKGIAGATPLMNVGTPTGGEVYIEIDPIKPEVCAQVNQMLYNDASIPQLGPGGTIIGFASPNYARDYHNDPATDSRPEGCLKSVDGVLAYYKTIIEQ